MQAHCQTRCLKCIYIPNKLFDKIIFMKNFFINPDSDGRLCPYLLKQLFLHENRGMLQSTQHPYSSDTQYTLTIMVNKSSYGLIN